MYHMENHMATSMLGKTLDLAKLISQQARAC